MSFGFPEAWWALGALSVPLIIHLLSKKKKRIIDFGALTFLQPSESASSQSLYLSDFWLLLIRSLFITLTIFLMSQLLVPDQQVLKSKIYVEESIANDKDYQSLNRQWEQDHDINHFTFDPTVDQNTVKYYPSAWSLIAALNKTTDSVTVYTHSLRRDFKGNALALRKGINWKVVPLANDFQNTLMDLSQEKLAIYMHNDKMEIAERLRAIIASITSNLSYEVEWKETTDEALLEVFIDAPFLNESKPCIHFYSGTHPLVINYLSHDALEISGKLNKEELLHSNLPVILAGFFNKLITESYQQDTRTIKPNSTEKATFAQARPQEKPLNKNWWALLLPVLLLERHLSHKSVQSS